MQQIDPIVVGDKSNMEASGVFVIGCEISIGTFDTTSSINQSSSLYDNATKKANLSLQDQSHEKNSSLIPHLNQYDDGEEEVKASAVSAVNRL